MVRGSGLDGLCGMSRRRDEGIYELIRPLLAQPREEIEEFLKECGQSYCTDETNLDTEYSRNRIRHVPNPEETMQEIIESINTNHPGILAKKILERVLLFTGGKVSDDMTILATCIWEK